MESPSFDVMSLLTRQDTRHAVSTYQENQKIYLQGDPADSVFYIPQEGSKLLSLTSLGRKLSSQSGDRTNSVAREP